MARFPFSGQDTIELGGRGKPMSMGASINYAAMVIRKERSRLADVFRKAGMQNIAADIEDQSKDLEIFKLMDKNQ
jgi:hypothetical protein